MSDTATLVIVIACVLVAAVFVACYFACCHKGSHVNSNRGGAGVVHLQQQQMMAGI